MKNSEVIIKILEITHNPLAKIRSEFFKREYRFFRKRLNNKRVFVAGSILGHYSFKLARHNKEIVSMELLRPLFEISKQNCTRKNITFLHGDFTKAKINGFDFVVLNMRTIGNFNDKNKILKKLLDIGKNVIFDFYPPTHLELRKKMYQEEKWKNVRINGTRIITDDRLNSVSIN